MSKKGEEATYELLDVDLFDPPAYFALSYAWGGQKPSETILCGGRNLKITKNVHSFLSQLSSMNEHLWIWIDSLCINQADDAEKNVQVPLMRDIYSGAAKVIVWLGPSNPLVEKAIDEMPSLTKKLDGFEGIVLLEDEQVAAFQLLERLSDT